MCSWTGPWPLQLLRAVPTSLFLTSECQKNKHLQFECETGKFIGLAGFIVETQLSIELCRNTNRRKLRSGDNIWEHCTGKLLVASERIRMRSRSARLAFGSRCAGMFGALARQDDYARGPGGQGPGPSTPFGPLPPRCKREAAPACVAGSGLFGTGPAKSK